MIRYSVSLDNPERHLFHVEIALSTMGVENLALEFPAWSPGRYFIYDFARNVQELEAWGEDNLPCSVTKITKGRWEIATRGAESLRITYKMFGDTLSGTFSQLDDRHAAINGSSLFGYIIGREGEEIELSINHPEGWHLYTSLPRRRRRGAAVWVATNYDVLIDSPIEVGRPLHRKFKHEGVDYHVVLDIASGEGTRASATVKERIDRYIGELETIVAAYTRTFGAPEFDSYHFFVNIDPSASGGDGMEHLNSTRLVLAGYITNDADYRALVAVSSHEFFHIWNVKRMRPRELGPFNYAQEHHTTLLWFAEGFTQYYGHLMAARSGVWDEKELLKSLASEVNNVDKAPGRFHRNLRESSFDTWHAVGRRSPIGSTSNVMNTWVNYYHKGAVAALVLDMEIRKLTKGRRSLDDLMLDLYRRSYLEAAEGEYFLRGSGYTEEDVLDAAARVGGGSIRRLLRTLIEKRDEIDYNRYLSYVGLAAVRGSSTPKEKKETPPRLYTGIMTLDGAERKAAEYVFVENVIPGSPAETAGISSGDVIIAIDGERVRGRDWESILAMKRPGNTLSVTLFRGSRLLSMAVIPIEQDVRPFRIESLKGITAAQRRAREKWIKG